MVEYDLYAVVGTTVVKRPKAHAMQDGAEGDVGVDIEVLQQAAASDVLAQFLDRHAGFYCTDVGLAQHPLVEGNLADNGEGLDLGRLAIAGYSMTGGREPLSRP